MEILLVAVVSAANIISFLIGARTAQQAMKGEEIKIPTVNPMEAVRERREKQEAQQEQSRLDTILQNIENYNGTAYGQKDVPGR